MTTETLPTIRPCPFCGSQTVEVQLLDNTTSHCYCRVCGALGPTALSQQSLGISPERAAIDEWNTRA